MFYYNIGPTLHPPPSNTHTFVSIHFIWLYQPVFQSAQIYQLFASFRTVRFVIEQRHCGSIIVNQQFFFLYGSSYTSCIRDKKKERRKEYLNEKSNELCFLLRFLVLFYCSALRQKKHKECFILLKILFSLISVWVFRMSHWTSST